MNLDERMASLQNKLNDKLNRLNGYGTSAAALSAPSVASE